MSSINYDELMQPVIAFLGCETPKEWLNEALNNLDIYWGHQFHVAQL